MKNKNIKFKPYLFSIIIFLVGAFFVDSMYIEPSKLEVKNIEVKRDDIAPEFDGKSIVFLSDIHYGVGNPKILDKVVDRVNAIEPDIVILGGDYVDHDPKLVDECFAKIEKIKAKIGMYAVLGNHDSHKDLLPVIIKKLGDSNITLLNNDNVVIRGGNSNIVLSGIPYYKKDTKLDLALKDIKKSDFAIFVSHAPDIVEEQDLKNIDVVLSGHLHGGQVNMFGLETFWMPTKYGEKYKTGIVYKNDLEVIISNGLGGSSLPMRFMAEPDIISLKLESDK